VTTTVLVIGGRGQLGLPVVRRLLEDGLGVRVRVPTARPDRSAGAEEELGEADDTDPYGELFPSQSPQAGYFTHQSSWPAHPQVAISQGLDGSSIRRSAAALRAGLGGPPILNSCLTQRCCIEPSCTFDERPGGYEATRLPSNEAAGSRAQSQRAS